MEIDWRFGGSHPWDRTLALNPRHLLSRRHQRRSLEIGPAKPSLRWPLQRTGSVSEGQAFFPSKFRRVAIITSSSVCLWQTSSKGSLIPLGTTCDDRVRMRKPVFSRNATGRLHCGDTCPVYSHIHKDVKILCRKLGSGYFFWSCLPQKSSQLSYMNICYLSAISS